MTDSASPLFTVTDPAELLALWRLIAEARFSTDPDDVDLWASPLVYSISRRVSDALLAVEESRGKGEMHTQWRASLPNNVALPAVIANLRREALKDAWRELDHVAKIAYVRRCIVPFNVSDDFISDLIYRAEA